MISSFVPAPGAVPRRSTGRIWILLIFGLILMNASIVAVTVYLALSDKSVAPEPDYYAKALRFDDLARLREASAALGWSSTAEIRPHAATNARSGMLSITLVDRESHPLVGVSVTAVAFPNARAGSRQSLRLAPGDVPGVYTAPIILERAGSWHLELTAVRDHDTFVSSTDLDVSSPQR